MNKNVQGNFSSEIKKKLHQHYNSQLIKFVFINTKNVHIFMRLQKSESTTIFHQTNLSRLDHEPYFKIFLFESIVIQFVSEMMNNILEIYNYK